MTNFSYNDAVPAANNNPSVDQPDMQINTLSTDQILAIDHISFNTNNGGQHKQITFNIDNASGFPYIPTIPTSPPVLFTQNVNALPELFYYSGDAAHGSSQYVQGTNGSTFLFGGIILKWFTVTSASTNFIQTFAGVGLTNFPNNAFGAVATIGGGVFTVNLQNLTVAQVQITKSAGSLPITVFVIGN
jgi:hypothetical protein